MSELVSQSRSSEIDEDAGFNPPRTPQHCTSPRVSPWMVKCLGFMTAIGTLAESMGCEACSFVSEDLWCVPIDHCGEVRGSFPGVFSLGVRGVEGDYV
jgi:hypothetical protein